MLLSRFEYQYNSSHPRVPILFSTLLCGGSAPRIKRNWAKFGTSDLFYLMPKNSFIGVLGIEWLRLIRLLFHGHLRSVMCFFFFSLLTASFVVCSFLQRLPFCYAMFLHPLCYQPTIFMLLVVPGTMGDDARSLRWLFETLFMIMFDRVIWGTTNGSSSVGVLINRVLAIIINNQNIVKFF